jgi:hypothetical protein
MHMHQCKNTFESWNILTFATCQHMQHKESSTLLTPTISNEDTNTCISGLVGVTPTLGRVTLRPIHVVLML